MIPVSELLIVGTLTVDTWHVVGYSYWHNGIWKFLCMQRVGLLVYKTARHAITYDWAWRWRTRRYHVSGLCWRTGGVHCGNGSLTFDWYTQCWVLWWLGISIGGSIHSVGASRTTMLTVSTQWWYYTVAVGTQLHMCEFQIWVGGYLCMKLTQELTVCTQWCWARFWWKVHKWRYYTVMVYTLCDKLWRWVHWWDEDKCLWWKVHKWEYGGNIWVERIMEMEQIVRVWASDFEKVKSLTAQFEYCVLNASNDGLDDNNSCLVLL